MITGIMIATVAVLFKKDERDPTPSIITNTINVELRLASLRSPLPKKFTAPALKSPALITNIAPTVTVAGLAKPLKPSAGVRIPDTRSTTITKTATTSVENFSVTNSTTATIVRPSTKAISQVTYSPFASF